MFDLYPQHSRIVLNSQYTKELQNIIAVWFLNKVLFLILQKENEDTSSILDKILNSIDWIITFSSGKYVETFHELRTEIEIQKIGFFIGYLILRKLKLEW